MRCGGGDGEIRAISIRQNRPLYHFSMRLGICTSLRICSSTYVLCIRRNDNGCRNSYTFDMKRPAKYTKGLFSTALTKDGRP